MQQHQGSLFKLDLKRQSKGLEAAKVACGQLLPCETDVAKVAAPERSRLAPGLHAFHSNGHVVFLVLPATAVLVIRL